MMVADVAGHWTSKLPPRRKIRSLSLPRPRRPVVPSSLCKAPAPPCSDPCKLEYTKQS